MERMLEQKQMEINSREIAQPSAADIFDNNTQQIDYNMTYDSYPSHLSNQYDMMQMDDFGIMNEFEGMNYMNSDQVFNII